jgi:predicted dehydrogenase
MSGQLRAAIVGCGRMGTQRARAARTLGATLVLADRNRLQAEALAGELPPGTATVVDGEPDWDAVDAVFVCTPASERGPVERAAARAGVAVFVEKPVALSATHALPILEAIEAAGVVNAVGYMNRYRATVAAAREELAGRDVFAVHCQWVGNRYEKPWWTDPARSGSPFADQAGHLVDLCRLLAGEISEVVALGRRALERPDVADVVAVSLGFASGACGSLLWSYRAAEKFVRLACYTPDRCVALEGWDFQLPGAATGPSTAGPDPITPIFLTETRAFLDAVRERDPAPIRCTFADAISTQLVVDAIKRSAASGSVERVERPGAVADAAV